MKSSGLRTNPNEGRVSLFCMAMYFPEAGHECPDIPSWRGRILDANLANAVVPVGWAAPEPKSSPQLSPKRYRLRVRRLLTRADGETDLADSAQIGILRSFSH